MVAGCGNKLIKSILFVFCFVFLAVGIGLIIAGSIALSNATSLPWMSSLPAGAVFIIVLGSVVFIISFFGCWGAMRESYCLMLSYSLCLAVLFLCEISGAIAGFAMKNQLTAELEGEMLATLPMYSTNANNMQASWDKLQQVFTCCGVYNASDWQNKLPSAQYSVPSSCCLPNATRLANCGQNVLLLPPTVQQSIIYSEGCYESLQDNMQSNILIVGVACVVVICIQLLGLIFSSCLVHEFRKQYESL